MTTQTKRKIGIVGLRTAGIASSVGMPAVAVLNAFPIWKEDTPIDGKTLGIGGVMILLIVLLGFRRQIWPLVKSKLHLNSLGAIIGWGVLFAVLLTVEKIVPLLPDLRTICIAGLTGTGIGQISDTVAGVLSKKITCREVNPSDQNGPVAH